jgi:tetratricopeptide (TPR) repeat protein
MVRIAIALAAIACTGGGAGGAEPPDLDPDTEVARRHFDRGTKSYQEQDYEVALREFEAARRVKSLPAFDYNIGRCQDRLERYPEAVAAYERYVASSVAPDVAEVRERIRVLKERIAEAEAAAKPAVPSPPAKEPAPAPAVPAAPPEAPAEPVRSPSPALPLVVGGLTVAAALAGTALYFGSALPGYQALDTGPDSCRPCTPADYAGVKMAAEASYGLWITAGVIAAVDVALWIVHALRARRSPGGEAVVRAAR